MKMAMSLVKKMMGIVMMKMLTSIATEQMHPNWRLGWRMAESRMEAIAHRHLTTTSQLVDTAMEKTMGIMVIPTSTKQRDPKKMMGQKMAQMGMEVMTHRQLMMAVSI